MIAAGIIPVRRRVTDPVLETVLALITPYAAFVAGEVLHVSPVMAVIVTGLVIGGRRERITTAVAGDDPERYADRPRHAARRPRTDGTGQ